MLRELYRASRGLYGTNSVYEASAIFDYNFLPVNEEQKVCSVHIFWRISGLMFNTTLEGNKFGFAIPFGAGLKYKFNYNWALFGGIYVPCYQ